MSRKRNDSIELLADARAGAVANGSGSLLGARKASPETKAVRFARGLAMGALVGAAVAGLLRYQVGRRHGREEVGRPAGRTAGREELDA